MASTIVEVWGLPADQSEEDLQALYEDIVSAFAKVEVPRWGLSEKREITVFFPPDRMLLDLGKEIIVWIRALAELRSQYKNFYAKAVGEAIGKRFPDALVEVRVDPFISDYGFWSSEK